MEKVIIQTVENHIHDIANILKIKTPEIYLVEYIMKKNGNIFAQTDPNASDDVLHGIHNMPSGFYSPELNTIYLSKKRIAGFNYIKNMPKLVVLNPKEYLPISAHELRHVWQRKYQNKKYFLKNKNDDPITDISEIDADAFAIAYCCSDKSPFSHGDFPFFEKELKFVTGLDNDQRKNRANQIAKNFGFKNVNLDFL